MSWWYCNKCGKPAVFGGFVRPAIYDFDRLVQAESASFWTDCDDCGRVYDDDDASSIEDGAE